MVKGKRVGRKDINMRLRNQGENRRKSQCQFCANVKLMTKWCHLTSCAKMGAWWQHIKVWPTLSHVRFAGEWTIFWGISKQPFVSRNHFGHPKLVEWRKRGDGCDRGIAMSFRFCLSLSLSLIRHPSSRRR